MWLRVEGGNKMWLHVGMLGNTAAAAIQSKEISASHSEKVADSDSSRASRK